ncbi:MAG: DUF2062 domain-containing protein [Candidatus Brocadiaceae bacterium]|nr:DUF2062 domain-containing protein [Candidatus Brocadiaceae bacterium]
MPDTVPQFSAKTWRAPNLAISSIAGNIQPHHEVILAALVMRVNIPVAIAASWITNPLTAPVIYPLQYRLGIEKYC